MAFKQSIKTRFEETALIFNYLRQIRMASLSLFIFIICGDFCIIPGENFLIYAQTAPLHIALTKDQPLSKQLNHFLTVIKKASKDECLKTFGRYGKLLAKELNFDRLYFVSYDEVKKLLDQAARESIDSLTLFTHPILQDPEGFAIIFNAGLLQQINKNFNFHGLFNISVPSIDDGAALKMQFLVIGQGKFIVGYNRNAKIKHPDYDFVTGHYDYNELFIMEAKKDSHGNSGLFDIKGVSNPNEKPKWMKGPLNVDIHSMIITSDNGDRRQIRIQYDLFGVKHKILKPIPIEKLYDG
jgi:hypothetical protein